MKFRLHRVLQLFILPLCIFIISFEAIAQKSAPKENDVNWSFQNIIGGIGNYSSPSNFMTSIVYFERAVVAAVQFKNDEWGVVKMNDDGKVLWQINSPAPAAGIARIQDKILLFYYDIGYLGKESGNYGFCKTFNLMVIDSNGRKISDKVVYENDQPIYMEPRIFSGEDGSFVSAFLRISECVKENKKYSKERAERLATKKALLIHLDANFSTKITNLPVTGQQGLFMGADLGKNGDIFICTAIDNLLMVERFRKSGETAGRLTTPLELPSPPELFIRPVVTINPLEKEQLLVGLTYNNKKEDPLNEVFGFDFQAMKVGGSGVTLLDKAYRKSLEVTGPDGPGRDLRAGDLIEDLTIIDIVCSDDRICVVKEIRSTIQPLKATRHTNNYLVISIYNRKWEMLKTITLNRDYESFNNVGGTVGVHLQGDKLQLLAADINGMLSFATIYVVIDLSGAKLETFKMLDKSKFPKLLSAEGGSTLWFKNKIFVAYLIEKGSFFKKYYHYSWDEIAL